MAIRYIHIPEKKKTIAVLKNTQNCAINVINKILGDTKSLCFDEERYKMHDMYRSVVVCYGNDEYDPIEGEKQAKAKLLDHYYEQLDKKVDMFINDLNTAMFNASVVASLHSKENDENT